MDKELLLMGGLAALALLASKGGPGQTKQMPIEMSFKITASPNSIKVEADADNHDIAGHTVGVRVEVGGKVVGDSQVFIPPSEGRTLWFTASNLTPGKTYPVTMYTFVDGKLYNSAVRAITLPNYYAESFNP